MAYERAKLRKTANKKAASPKKSMRLRSATLFCSNQDTTVCFPTLGYDLFHILNGSLGGSEAGNGHTEGATGHVVQTDLVAEFNGDRIAAVLAADTVVQVLAGGLALGDSHLHQHTNTGLIQLCKGIVLIDLGLIVSVQELTCIVTAKAEGHLG